jgi:hypothetical protein
MPLGDTIVDLDVSTVHLLHRGPDCDSGNGSMDSEHSVLQFPDRGIILLSNYTAVTFGDAAIHSEVHSAVSLPHFVADINWDYPIVDSGSDLMDLEDSHGLDTLRG